MQSDRPILVVSVVLVLSFTSCGALRHTPKEPRLEEMKVEYQPALPVIETEIRLPLEQLKQLPENLPVSQRKQHVTATLERHADTILITARSDSIAQTVSATHQIRLPSSPQTTGP